LIKQLLLERLSLLGICRVMQVSLRWLLTFIGDLYEALPDDLNSALPQKVSGPVRLLRLDAEADERWRFVKHKANKQGVWMALDVETIQVIAFYVGDRSRQSARKFWHRIPREYREQATFHTDAWEAYQGVIPDSRHRVCAKGSSLTNAIERFNCTL
jgi:insertion element IS1 protein InsB